MSDVDGFAFVLLAIGASGPVTALGMCVVEVVRWMRGTK